MNYVGFADLALNRAILGPEEISGHRRGTAGALPVGIIWVIDPVGRYGIFCLRVLLSRTVSAQCRHSAGAVPGQCRSTGIGKLLPGCKSSLTHFARG